MFISKRQREIINAMFVPPQDYDAIQIQTPETSDEPVLIITLYKNKQVVFFHNYELESDRLYECNTLSSNNELTNHRTN